MSMPRKHPSLTKARQTTKVFSKEANSTRNKTRTNCAQTSYLSTSVLRCNGNENDMAAAVPRVLRRNGQLQSSSVMSKRPTLQRQRRIRIHDVCEGSRGMSAADQCNGNEHNIAAAVPHMQARQHLVATGMWHVQCCCEICHPTGNKNTIVAAAPQFAEAHQRISHISPTIRQPTARQQLASSLPTVRQQFANNSPTTT